MTRTSWFAVAALLLGTAGPLRAEPVWTYAWGDWGNPGPDTGINQNHDDGSFVSFRPENLQKTGTFAGTATVHLPLAGMRVNRDKLIGPDGVFDAYHWSTLIILDEDSRRWSEHYYSGHIWGPPTGTLSFAVDGLPQEHTQTLILGNNSYTLDTRWIVPEPLTVNSTGAIELEVRVTATTLPEPTAIALFGLGVPAVCLFLRRSGARCQGAPCR
jgi:hypothetical protein